MVELGDNSTYSIQGVGSTSFQLSWEDTLNVEDIIYVPILNNNLLYVSVIEYKHFPIIFMENQAYLWPKNQNIDTATVIGV